MAWLIDDEELLLSFEQFPWFRKRSIEQVSRVERPTLDHIYWPDLDIDRSNRFGNLRLFR